MPSHLTIEEHLSFGNSDLKLTGVAVPNETDRLRFLALRRDALILLSPAVEQDEALASEFTTSRQVACLFPSAILRGTLEVFSNLRLSDHLQQQGQVVTMRHCLLAPYGATMNSPGSRTMASAIVKLDHAIGISEM